MFPWAVVLAALVPAALPQYRDSSRAYASPELVRQPESRRGGARKNEETPRGD